MKVVGFDLDGTILNSEPLKAKAFARLMADYGEVDQSKTEAFWFEQLGIARQLKFERFFWRFFRRKLTEEQFFEIEGIFSSRLREEVYPYVKILPGALDLLRIAKERADFVFLASTTPEREVEIITLYYGLGGFFDLALGTNKRLQNKSAELERVLEKIKPTLAVFVGDSTEDITSAGELGFVTVGITTHLSSLDLKKAGADFVGGSYEIAKYLRELLS